MFDHQRIVEEIQAALLSQATLDWDLLRDAAVEYAMACEEVNERLAECQQLLKRGLRSEAIQAAEREPNLLDGIAQLDFPELSQWQQTLTAGGMVAPPPLRIEVASELNAAYAAEAPLQSLLKSHRLLALSRASLPARIQVLRNIRLADIMNPVWTDDLRVLETARHQELQRDLTAAFQGRNLSRLASFVAELEDPAWVYSPQAQFVSQAKSLRQRLAAALATEEMQQIERDLSHAHSALDADAGRAARVRWNGCQHVAALGDGHPLVERAAPALHWLSQEDKNKSHAEGFAAAVSGLADALENDAGRRALERLFHAAKRYDEEIPLRLVRRYEERIRACELTAHRRFTLLSAVTVMTLLLIGSVVAWVIYRGQRDQAIANAALGLAQLVADKNLPEAQNFYEQLEQRQPGIASLPEVQQELGRLNGLVAAETTRRESFENLLTRAIDAGIEIPDRSALVEAGKLAATFGEKTRVSEWRAKLDARDRERQRERDGRFENDFQQLLGEVEQFEQRIERSVRIENAAIDALVARIDGLQDRSAGVTQQLASQVKPLRLRVNALSRQLIDARAQEESLARLTVAVGKPDSYVAALESFIKNHGASSLGAEFQRVANEARWWKHYHQWKNLLEDRRFAELAKLAPADAKTLLELAKPLLTEANEFPLAQHFTARQPYIEAVANRIDESGRSRVEPLQAIFDDALLRELWVLKTKDDKRYYLRGEKSTENVVATNRIRFKAITSLDLSERTVTVKQSEVEYHGPAPQVRLASLAEPELRRVRQGEWESGFYSLIRGVAEQQEIDPLLQFILLRRIVEIARQGSHSLEAALQPTWERLESAPVDQTANWLSPDDKAADQARGHARTVVRRFDTFREESQRAAEILRADTAPLPPVPSWLGWLRPLGKNLWKCESPVSLPTSGELHVLSSSNAGPVDSIPPTWVRVATCRNEGIRWETADDSRFVAGRPIFHFTGTTPIAAE